MYETSLQSLDSAIAQTQSGTVTLTEQQTADITTQADVVQTRANELMQISGEQTAVSAQNPTETETAMTGAVSTLMKLPAATQTQANVETARQAYFDYLTASPEGKAAAYDEVVKLLGESIESVVGDSSLDAGTRAELEGLLGEIDRGRITGDNINGVGYDKAIYDGNCTIK